MSLLLRVEAFNKDIKAKENFAHNHFRNTLRLSDFLMFYQIFFSTQVKRSVIVTYKHGIASCLTSCRTTQDLGSKEIRKHQESLKTS